MQLTKDIILNAAMELLDTYGLGDLTIRRLTRQLGVAAGAMYWHFPSKQALLGAVADRIMQPLTRISPADDWKISALQFTEQLHTCLTDHRDGAEVVAAALATKTASISPEQLLTHMLCDVPSNVTSTKDIARTLVFFVLGATVDEQTAQALATTSEQGNQKTTAAEAKRLGDARIRAGAELILGGVR